MRFSTLDLSDNPLTGVDFTHVSPESLNNVNLANTQLTSINLQPFSKCPFFFKLNLKANNLTEIDLRPLSNCKRLHTINLHHNKLTKVELEPLGGCKSLKWLTLTANEISTLEIKPLINCKKLMKLAVDDLTKLTWDDELIPHFSNLPPALRTIFERIEPLK